MYTRVCNAGVSRPGRVFSRPVLERMTTCGVQTAPQQYASTTAAYEVTERLLADETYHIEFNGYLSNHAKHAVIGLYGLDASPKAIQKYWDMCAPRPLLSAFSCSVTIYTRCVYSMCGRRDADLSLGAAWVSLGFLLCWGSLE